jgi:GTP-binding protein
MISIFISGRSEGTTQVKYKIPTRGLLGLRNAILTASRGTAILNTVFDCYGPWAGDMSTRDLGSLVMLHLDF